MKNPVSRSLIKSLLCHKNVSRIGKAVAFLTIILSAFTARTQSTIRIYSEENKDTFVGFSGMLQVWGRYTDLNPGSTIDGRVRNNTFDLSVRRYRMQMYGQLNGKARFAFQIGNNNLNYVNNASSPKILDAFVEHQFTNAFTFGFGKNGWTGLSRYASPSSGAAIDFDITYMATPLVNINDSFLRRLGVFAHGQIKRLDYRVELSKPFKNPFKMAALSDRAVVSNNTPDFHTSAYVKYQFRDTELQTPFSTATYMGEKNILNIGIGALYQPNTTVSLINNDTIYHDAKMFALDLFYERPFNTRNTLTFYLAYLKNDLGPKYVRTIGANNPVDLNSPSTCFNGSGNNMPVSGTGNLINLQLAYLHVVKLNTHQYKIQPFVSMEYGKLTALENMLFIYDAGVNYFIKGHHSKITLGYQNRPVYLKTENKVREAERKSMIVLQYQFKIG